VLVQTRNVRWTATDAVLLRANDRFENLLMRFEEPSSMVRWDSPLITVAWDEPYPLAAIWDSATSGDKKPPSASVKPVGPHTIQCAGRSTDSSVLSPPRTPYRRSRRPQLRSIRPFCHISMPRLLLPHSQYPLLLLPLLGRSSCTCPCAV